MATKNGNKENRMNSIDRFEFVRELGRGGTGIVYLVRSKESCRQYAMKVLKPELGKASNADAELKDAETNEAGEFGAVAAELLRAEAETLQ